MRPLLLASLAGLALLATTPVKAQDFYAGVGPFGVYVGPGYDYNYGPDWRWRHHRYGYGDDWRWRHYHRYYHSEW
jgi:hypothetical protein